VSHHAGSRFLEIEDGATTFRTWLVYPTSEPAHDVRFGPFAITVSPDAPLLASNGRRPLVLVSHGTGSSPFLLRTLALRLVAAGFVVALVEHPGNHRGDDTLAGTDENLMNRPRHLRLALDAVARDEACGPNVATERVAVVGHSVGGYTALALAGGTPWSRSGERLATESDPRTAALVLLTPAVFWYVPDGALRGVDVPILAYAGEEDTTCPPWHIHLVHGSVRDRSKVILRTLPHTGHLSVLAELPSTAAYRDPPGFDRATVHDTLGTEITAFLERAIRP